MKFTLPFFILLVAVTTSIAEGIKVQQIQPENTPEAIRISFLQSQLGIQGTIWTCSVKEGYTAYFSFFRKDTEKPKLEFTIGSGQKKHVFLFIKSEKDGSSDRYVTFGYEEESTTIFMGSFPEFSIKTPIQDETSQSDLFEIRLTDQTGSDVYYARYKVKKN